MSRLPSIKRLKDLNYDPLSEMVNNAESVKREIKNLEEIRSGTLVRLDALGRKRYYSLEIHMNMYDKLININDKLMRYAYARVPETTMIEGPPQPLIINLSNGESKILNGKEDELEDDQLT